MAITVEMLRCFHMVAKHGSLAGAATALGRTPPAVSVMLQKFEERVGSPLFETKRKSRLTPLGQMLHSTVQHHLDEFSQVEKLVDSLARGEAGRVRLAVTPTVATALMPDVVHEFRKTHPKVLIEIHDMDSSSVRRDLEKGRADIGVATLPPLIGFERTKLLSDELGVLCLRDHPLTTKQTPLEWTDIAGYDFIKNGLCYLIEDTSFQRIVESSVLSVANHASLIAFLNANVGITVLPKLALPQDLPKIAFLPLPKPKPLRTLYLITSPRKLLLPAAQAFAEVLESVATGMKYSEFLSADD